MLTNDFENIWNFSLKKNVSWKHSKCAQLIFFNVLIVEFPECETGKFWTNFVDEWKFQWTEHFKWNAKNIQRQSLYTYVSSTNAQNVLIDKNKR